MKAIMAKYYGPTNFKGSRIKVWADGCKPEWHSYRYESNDGGKADCIIEYAIHHNWKGTLNFGTDDKGVVIGIFSNHEEVSIK